jgi:hypothetical protein
MPFKPTCYEKRIFNETTTTTSFLSAATALLSSSFAWHLFRIAGLHALCIHALLHHGHSFWGF